MKISIIVSAYNNGRFIFECVTSILRAINGLHAELIIVDDCSTDDTLTEIRRGVRDAIAPVNIIDKKANEGLVASRKSGFLASRGEYVSFIDGDDFVSQNHYKDIVNSLLENASADVVCMGFTQVTANGDLLQMKNNFDPDIYLGEKKNELVAGMLFNKNKEDFGIFSYLWCKIFRRELIPELINNVDDDIFLGEDACITYPAINLAESVLVSEIDSYYYRQHGASGVRSFDNFSDEMKKLKKVHKFLLSHLSKISRFGCLDKNTMIDQVSRYLIILVLSRSDPLKLIGSIKPFSIAIVDFDAKRKTYILGDGLLQDRYYMWLSAYFPNIQKLSYAACTTHRPFGSDDIYFICTVDGSKQRRFRELLISLNVDTRRIFGMNLPKYPEARLDEFWRENYAL